MKKKLYNTPIVDAVTVGTAHSVCQSVSYTETFKDPIEGDPGEGV